MKAEKPTSPSEALFAFMGWLTTRRRQAGPFSSTHNAAQAADLVKEYCDLQGWDEPREGWETLLTPGILR